MEQLGLALANRLPYEAKNFFIHHGVEQCIDKIQGMYSLPIFGIGYVFGAPRSGKTHLSIKVGDIAATQGLLPRYVDGGEFASWVQEKMPSVQWTDRDVVIVDDAHLYLMKLSKGESGLFVHCIESLRKMQVKVLLFSKYALQELPCDEHVMSRLHPAEGFDIEAPEEGDMHAIVRCMGTQRGMSLKDRHVDFVVRRIGRSIVEVEQYFDRVMHLSQVLGRKIQYPILGDAV